MQTMLNRRHATALAGFLAVLALATLTPRVAGAVDQFPTKPVQLISPAPAGNGPDVVARLIADELGKLWGQQAVVVNRPGGSGLIAANAAVHAVPDGYTLYIANTSSMVALPHIQKLSFDIHKDFKPIGMVGEQPMVIAVAPSLGVNSLADLIALAKKKPGEVNFAAATRDSIPRYTTELLLAQAGASMTYVFYGGGTSQAIGDIMGGRLSVVVESWPALAGAIAAGSIKPIAVTSAKRMPEHPDVPTAAETFPGFVVTAWIPLLAPAKTPDAVVQKVSKDLRTITDRPDVQAKLAKLGTYVRPMTPDELASFMVSEDKKWLPAIQKVSAAGTK
ncbi:MAG TPA: tripartite tricarboxylate transporter substrate binding protein [Pseudolabrys sp.]|nr:tripartite tricarboxylate transporter substrate binding protein [Pseudolabrys sp.]